MLDPSGYLDCDVIVGNTHAVVRAVGEVDIGSSPLLHDHVRQLLSLTFHTVVDLSGVTFADGSCVRVLLASQRLADELGVAFQLRNPSRSVTRVLDLTGMLGAVSLEALPPELSAE